MNNSKTGLVKTLPVFMSFIVMGFVDIVGVATGFIKKDFGLTDDLAQLIPSMALFWFFVMSVPSGILQDKYGKKRMLNIGMLLTGLGMVIPFLPLFIPDDACCIYCTWNRKYNCSGLCKSSAS